MSRPIKLSDKLIKKLVDGITDQLKGHKLFDDSIDLSYDIPTSDKKEAVLIFDAVAYAKMLMLLGNFDTEVAWHGTAERVEGSTFKITDIIVYPQRVTGGTVNTDQEEYEKWLYSLDDEQFNNLRFQGHSHVNFGPYPSSVDLSHQERIVEQLEDDMFYIFGIWNKKLDYSLKIFDLADNTLYTKDDITIFIDDMPLDDKDFISDAKKLVSTSKAYAVSSKPYTKAKAKEEIEDDERDYIWQSSIFDALADFE